MRGDADPAQRLEARVAQLDEALALTDAQADALRTLLAEQNEEMQAMRAAGTRPDRDALMARREAHTKAVEALLTSEQVEKYRKLLAAEAANRPRRGGRNG